MAEAKIKDSKDVVKVVLYDKNNHVLFLRRHSDAKKYPGEWDLPGGHKKIGEGDRQALIREVEEETGLNLKETLEKNAEPLVVMGKKKFFKASLPKGKIEISSEHSDHKLIDVSKIKDPSKFEKIAIEVMNNDI